MTSKSKNYSIRNDKWLFLRLNSIWTKYFADIPKQSRVFIRFGRFAKLRLGSIKYDRETCDTKITITSMFKDSWIPKDVVDYTIAHELVHYSHGFSSLHIRLHKYPHAGGIIKKEMLSRGLGKQFCAYKDWIKIYRKSFSRYG